MGDRATRLVRLRVLVLIVVVFAAVAVFVWWRSRHPGFDNDVIDFSQAHNANSSQDPALSSSSPAPSIEVNTNSATPAPSSSLNTESPSPSPTDVPAPNASPALPVASYVGVLKLIIPVVGVRPDQLLDTFSDARSEGRVHDAIDIPAPAGTPVVAAADGEVLKLFQSERGGTTIYQLSPDKKLVFYYAHLQRYADGLVAGKLLRQGEVIGYVGDTGNAGVGNFHLHFSISVIDDPKRYWEGANINPFPLLRK